MSRNYLEYKSIGEVDEPRLVIESHGKATMIYFCGIEVSSGCTSIRFDHHAGEEATIALEFQVKNIGISAIDKKIEAPDVATSDTSGE